MFNSGFCFRSIKRPQNKLTLNTVEQSVFIINDVFSAAMRTNATDNELSFAVLLDNDNALMEAIYVAIGDKTSTNFYYKQLALRARKLGSKKLIMMHTHPSGSLVPSRKDVTAVSFFKTYFAEWGIKLIDSCILSGNSFYSMGSQKVLDMKKRSNPVRFNSLYKNAVLKKVCDFSNCTITELFLPLHFSNKVFTLKR